MPRKLFNRWTKAALRPASCFEPAILCGDKLAILPETLCSRAKIGQFQVEKLGGQRRQLCADFPKAFRSLDWKTQHTPTFPILASVGRRIKHFHTAKKPSFQVADFTVRQFALKLFDQRRTDFLVIRAFGQRWTDV